MFTMDNLERKKRGGFLGLGAFNPTNEEFLDFRSMVLDNASSISYAEIIPKRRN